MARQFSSTAIAAFMAQNTDEVALVLLHVEYTTSSGTTHHYLVNNTEDVTSGGQVYTAYPFALSLPDESDGKITSIELTIDNIERSLVDGIRACIGPISVGIQIVLASDPDTVELELSDWILRQVQYDALTIRGQIYPADMLNTRLPAEHFTPATAPGLF